MAFVGGWIEVGWIGSLDWNQGYLRVQGFSLAEAKSVELHAVH